jgi:hypothetical protein
MGMGKVMTTADAIQTFVDNGNLLFIGGYAGIRRIRIQHRIPRGAHVPRCESVGRGWWHHSDVKNRNHRHDLRQAF